MPISITHNLFLFLLYSPLNQGLKPHFQPYQDTFFLPVFTLQSIKSRIETLVSQRNIH